MSEKEKNAIEILKTFARRRRTKNYNKIDYGDVEATEIVLNLIEKQEKELQSADHLASVEFIEHNYISKDKIKDKLEKYEEDYERQNKEELYNMTKITAGRISVLEELLGSNK